MFEWQGKGKVTYSAQAHTTEEKWWAYLWDIYRSDSLHLLERRLFRGYWKVCIQLKLYVVVAFTAWWRLADRTTGSPLYLLFPVISNVSLYDYSRVSYECSEYVSILHAKLRVDLLFRATMANSTLPQMLRWHLTIVLSLHSQFILSMLNS